MILCSRCQDPTYSYAQRPFDINPRHDVGAICEGCHASVYEAWSKTTLRGISQVYRWGPLPVFEAMRRSLFARPFCDQCRRDSAVAFTQCLDYHPRVGDVCEGCGSVYEVPPSYTSFPFSQTYWRRRGALEVMREALGLLRPVSECEPASGVVVKPPRPVAR